MAKMEDFTGRVFGRLTVLSHENKRKNGYIVWKCQCECGNICYKKSLDLKTSYGSCGCYTIEKSKEHNTKHGKTYSREYNSWQGAKSRCLNKNNKDYPRYGGRGIKVCDRWLESFDNFYEDMGDRPEGYTLDRIDPNGNYGPSNCRWADSYTQNHNKKTKENPSGERNIRLMEYGYVIKMSHQKATRTSLTIKNIEKAIKLRNEWELEYLQDDKKWVDNTLKKKYNRNI